MGQQRDEGEPGAGHLLSAVCRDLLVSHARAARLRSAQRFHKGEAAHSQDEYLLDR